MSVQTPWQRLDFGTDLDWVNDDWSTLVTVGDGRAEFYWRRDDSGAYYTLIIVIGSTTVLPGGQWFFEMPAALLDTDGSAAAKLAVGVGYTYQIEFPNRSQSGFSAVYASPGSPTGVAMSLFLPDRAYGGSGACTGTYPHAWAEGDYAYFTGTSHAFAN